MEGKDEGGEEEEKKKSYRKKKAVRPGPPVEVKLNLQSQFEIKCHSERSTASSPPPTRHSERKKCEIRPNTYNYHDNEMKQGKNEKKANCNNVNRKTITHSSPSTSSPSFSQAAVALPSVPHLPQPQHCSDLYRLLALEQQLEERCRAMKMPESLHVPFRVTSRAGVQVQVEMLFAKCPTQSALSRHTPASPSTWVFTGYWTISSPNTAASQAHSLASSMGMSRSQSRYTASGPPCLPAPFQRVRLPVVLSQSALLELLAASAQAITHSV